ncbi:OmpA family protein [Thiocapsa sp. UBA6158]|jgi:outer membrane protein OmpA-like peptidoglycan-associated protein|uniref:OmpA family protein n=1 Tax=Thiocapsa sp. UBA6158 TaxID=1947692 RepID=UPI0025EE4D3B|nr:OmpA family protein [Thiocapsa sp. UBA6158]
MLRMIAISLTLTLSALNVAADAAIPDADLAGSQDPAFLKRYAGSLIVSYDDKAFDDYLLPIAPLRIDPDPKRRDGHNNLWFAPTEALELEGRLVRLVYLIPEGRSPLEVLRNYRDEIETQGGRALFECKREECGGDPGRSSGGGGGKMSLAMVLRPAERIVDPLLSTGACAQTERIQDQRYLAAALPDGPAHLSILAYVLNTGHSCRALNGRTITVVDLIEGKPREQRMVTIDAPEMARAIDATGRIALYGILFDFDQATVKPDSSVVLAEIATLLRSDAHLKLLVVGHTDNAGGFDYNRDLSQRRAEAVVTKLVQDHGADQARLFPVGVSFAAPVASNQTEEGRSQNRRVELVRY